MNSMLNLARKWWNKPRTHKCQTHPLMDVRAELKGETPAWFVRLSDAVLSAGATDTPVTPGDVLRSAGWSEESRREAYAGAVWMMRTLYGDKRPLFPGQIHREYPAAFLRRF